MNKSKKTKNRFSVPEILISSLFYDDEYFRSVSKIKKTGSGFPKEDQWIDSDGFHISFALAGYSKDNVTIEVANNTLHVFGSEINDDLPAEGEQATSISKGKIIRGIARRKFSVKYFIGEEFDVYSSKAIMKYGLLHIIIPKKTSHVKNIEILDGE